MKAKAEEIITWKECRAISEDLIAKASAFDEALYQAFPAKKGLYIFCYEGTELGGSLWEKESPIIYIGRAGADSIRHWRDNTGVSTVRRSLAAMLASALGLEAIPGSDDPEDNDRYTNYRLTPESEIKLTEWMQKNIQVAFWEMPEDEVEDRYNALVNFNTPKLNFQGNPYNTFGQQIKSYRKILTEMAMAYDLNQNEAAK